MKVKSILITQPKPDSEKNPYTDLAKKYNLRVDFRSFIYVEEVSVKDFRKEKINLPDFTAAIFIGRTAIDQFFRLCEELRYDVSTKMKYFCNTESTALYLQKYIQYRKRKVFFGKQTISELLEVSKKHTSEKFIFPCSDNHTEHLPAQMREAGYDVTDAVMYRTACCDLSDLGNINYDMIAFFSPLGIKSLFKNFPEFSQKKTLIAAFGGNTHKAVISAGLALDVRAPTPESPSMTMAIEEYIKNIYKESR